MQKFSIVSHIHNDEEYIPYFIKHWIDRVDCAYIIDDGPSTDGGMDIIRKLAPHWMILERESAEWDAIAVDSLCRHIERQLDGWVVSVTCDEYIYSSRSELDDIFESANLNFIQTEGWQVIQHPSELFDSSVGFEKQFFWGIPEPMISRTIHRNQQMINWEYTPGRHSHLGFETLSIHPLLGDHKYAPKEMSFRHRLIDGSRVGKLDQSRGFGLNKVGLTIEKLEIEYNEILSRARKFR